MNRQYVYSLIDGERNYQDFKWGSSGSSGTQGNGDRTIDEFILYIYGYAQDAVKEASHFGDASKKLDVVRKVAALCVACMEQHGAPART